MMMHQSPGFIIELEQEVLGSLLRGTNIKLEAASLQLEHFIDPFHRQLFENIVLSVEQYDTASPPIVRRLFTDDQCEAAKKSLAFHSRSTLPGWQQTAPGAPPA